MARNPFCWSSVHSAQDQFFTTSIGSVLVLKAAGLIQELNARIIDVGEDHLKLRLGAPWWKYLLGQARTTPPLELFLEFRQVEDRPAYAPQIPQASVCVQIRSYSSTLSSDEFQLATHRLRWQLRYHFMACA